MLVSHQLLVSYSQIYNEVICDLLNPSSGFLDLREVSRGSSWRAGVTEVSTTNAQEVSWAMVHSEGRGFVLSGIGALKFPDTPIACAELSRKDLLQQDLGATGLR